MQRDGIIFLTAIWGLWGTSPSQKMKNPMVIVRVGLEVIIDSVGYGIDKTFKHT